MDNWVSRYTSPERVQSEVSRLCLHFSDYFEGEKCDLLRDICSYEFLKRNAVAVQALMYLMNNPEDTSYDPKLREFAFPRSPVQISDESEEEFEDEHLTDGSYEYEPIAPPRAPQPKQPVSFPDLSSWGGVHINSYETEAELVEELKLYITGLAPKPKSSLLADVAIQYCNLLKPSISLDLKPQICQWKCLTVCHFLYKLQVLNEKIIAGNQEKCDKGIHKNRIIEYLRDNLEARADLVGVSVPRDMPLEIASIEHLESALFNEDIRKQLLNAWDIICEDYLLQNPSYLCDLANGGVMPLEPSKLEFQNQGLISFCFPESKLFDLYHETRRGYSTGDLAVQIENKQLALKIKQQIQQMTSLQTII